MDIKPNIKDNELQGNMLVIYMKQPRAMLFRIK